MDTDHPAARCTNPSPSPRLSTGPGPSSDRQRSIAAFLPSRPPPTGQPSLSGCVARVDVLGHLPSDAKEVISRGLATRFEGSSLDFEVASFLASSMAVFFPNWVVRESTISRSPLRFGNSVFRFSNWLETCELERGHLQHMVCIRLLHWPILCWSCEDVKAAISCFRELWEVDPLSEMRDDVSFFRARIRCQNVHCVPKMLNLMVDDRRFRIPIEVDSWEETNPILLGEELDGRLGLDSVEAQDSFIRQTGFSSIPPMGSQGRVCSDLSRRSARVRSHMEDFRQLRREWRPILGETSNSNLVACLPSFPQALSYVPSPIYNRGAGRPLAPNPTQRPSVTPSLTTSGCPPVLDYIPCRLLLGPPAEAEVQPTITPDEGFGAPAEAGLQPLLHTTKASLHKRSSSPLRILSPHLYLLWAAIRLVSPRPLAYSLPPGPSLLT